MKFNISAGHNPDGKIACGASGYIKESTEARKVTNEVIRLLKERGHTVYNCTCDNGTGQTDVLRKICNKANSHTVDCDVSIHFNSSNGQGNGAEVLYKTSDGAKWATKVQKAIVKNISFKNRGIKKRDNLYYLNNTKNVAILIECCFVDNKSDVNKYNYKKMAESIVEGLTGEVIKKEVFDMDKIVLYHGDADVFAAVIVAQKYKCPMMKESDFKISGLKAKEVVQIGGKAVDANRFQTFKNAAKLL